MNSGLARVAWNVGRVAIGIAPVMHFPEPPATSLNK